MTRHPEPASETPGPSFRDMDECGHGLPVNGCERCRPSETQGPGEGDLRGGSSTAFWRDSAYAMEQARDHFRAERDAAVEQRTLAEQRVAARRAAYGREGMGDYRDGYTAALDDVLSDLRAADDVERHEGTCAHSMYGTCGKCRFPRAAIADPEADRCIYCRQGVVHVRRDTTRDGRLAVPPPPGQEPK